MKNIPNLCLLARGCRSYRQMAAESGVAKSELFHLEKGDVSPRLVTAVKICQVAANNVTIDDFIKATEAMINE